MSELKKFKIKIIEILFYAFPLSFILGNFILSTNLLLFIVFSLFFIKSERLSFRFKNSYHRTTRLALPGGEKIYKVV